MMSKKEEMKDGFCQKKCMFVNIYPINLTAEVYEKNNFTFSRTVDELWVSNGMCPAEFSETNRGERHCVVCSVDA